MDEFFPPGLSMPASPSLAVNPVDGSIVVAGDETGPDSILVLARDTRGVLVLRERIQLPAIVAPRDVQVSHDGHIFFTSRGVIRELVRGTTGWTSVSISPFAGQSTGSVFYLRNSNFVQGDWTNTPSDFTTTPPDGGPGVPDCLADFNGDNELNPDDLADYIAAYFSQPPALGADFNDDNEVNPDDLSDYINAYFNGCR